jgi:alkylation response protein AidB-like acyl-CoA dehydrogenase
VRFSFSDEHEEFRRVVRRFLADHSPPGEVRRLMETGEGYDPAVWQRLSSELGLPGIHIPEQYGGQGFGFVELGIALEEMGRSLLCAPYFASAVLAANAIQNAATEPRKKELLPEIASGERIATVAFAEPSGGWDAAAIELTATATGGGFRLDGTKSFVLDGHTADTIIVVARAPGSSGEDGLSFFTVAGDSRGLERRLLSTVDATRKQARLEFAAVEAQLLGELGRGAAALSLTLAQAAIALANEMVGGAQLVLDATVEYAKTRVQFGRQIGSFQAIKHKCADMLLEVEQAKSAAYCAASAMADGADDVLALASLAKASASDAYVLAVSESIQIHGGVGFTWENDTHLYYKRARSSEAFLGSPDYHRELLLQRWGIS